MSSSKVQTLRGMLRNTQNISYAATLSSFDFAPRFAGLRCAQQDRLLPHLFVTGSAVGPLILLLRTLEAVWMLSLRPKLVLPRVLGIKGPK